jgi:hypothetical protein
MHLNHSGDMHAATHLMTTWPKYACRCPKPKCFPRRECPYAQKNARRNLRQSLVVTCTRAVSPSSRGSQDHDWTGSEVQSGVQTGKVVQRLVELRRADQEAPSLQPQVHRSVLVPNEQKNMNMTVTWHYVCQCSPRMVVNDHDGSQRVFAKDELAWRHYSTQIRVR